MLGNFGNILLAALGISFLIFIHEAGHFLAARLFKVRVETFSLGFGPRLLGFRRGQTDYRLSLVPLGGYVKMAGEYGDHDADAPLAADDLMAKPAWQRAIIFSAGVIVNFAFAFVAFPLAFALGVPFTAPVVGSITPGGPAWAAGVQIGDEILTINGNRIYEFPNIALEVALGDPHRSELTLRREGIEQRVPVRPSRNDSEGRWELGIGPAGDNKVIVAENSPASRAGLVTGDRVASINGKDVTALSAAPTLNMAMLGQPVDLVWEHEGERRESRIEPLHRTDPDHARLGVMAVGTRIAGLRGPALEPQFGWRADDVVLSVGGRRVFQADELLEALEAAPAGSVATIVRRNRQSLEVSLPAEQRSTIGNGDVAFGTDLGSSVVQVLPEGALAAAGLRDGDQIVSINGEPIEDYADLQREVRGSPKTCEVRYRGADDGAVHTLTVSTQPAPILDYGLSPAVLETLHAEGLSGAMRAGFDTSLNIVRTTWLTLTKLFTGDVATKNLGGIVSISVVTYRFAELGLPKLLFFLGLLSINLGFINVLPIPVLDGGQVMFLILEKIKGRRLSERFMNGMQLAGLAAIVLLVLYVTYNDISRLVG